jgi:hypothetical protein
MVPARQTRQRLERPLPQDHPMDTARLTLGPRPQRRRHSMDRAMSLGVQPPRRSCARRQGGTSQATQTRGLPHPPPRHHAEPTGATLPELVTTWSTTGPGSLQAWP